MSQTRALRAPLSLKLLAFGFLGFWCLIAAFPIFWITMMSLKDPIDAFSANPFVVIFGDVTRETGIGVSAFGVIVTGVAAWWAIRIAVRSVPVWARALAIQSGQFMAWIIAVLGYLVLAVIVALLIIPGIIGLIDPWLGPFGQSIIGVTPEHYLSVWIQGEFYRNFINSMIVTTGVVAISLSFGTLAGFGLARSRIRTAFWILIAALIFRASAFSAGCGISAGLREFRRDSPARVRCLGAHALRHALAGDIRSGRHQPALHDLDAALVLCHDPV